MQHSKRELAAFHKLFVCQNANVSPWVSCMPCAPWHTEKQPLSERPCGDHSDATDPGARSLAPAAPCSLPHPLLHKADTKKVAPRILYSSQPVQPRAAEPVPRCRLSLAEQEVKWRHLRGKINGEVSHSIPEKMAQPWSWRHSHGGEAAREPQHQWFPPNSQKNRVCYILQKPHLTNLLCTPALLWEFYSIC